MFLDEFSISFFIRFVLRFYMCGFEVSRFMRVFRSVSVGFYRVFSVDVGGFFFLGSWIRF